MRDKISVEVAETQKGLYFFDRSQYWPIPDSIDLCHIHGYTSRLYNHSKVFHFLCIKCAFLWFQEEPLFPYDFQYSVGYSMMFV
jgi:hypothetical protein